jgi:hypothetical protein
MRSRLIHAHFPGKCRICSKTVCKGEEVYFAKHYGVRCLSCGPHTDPDQPMPAKRGSKRYARSAAPTPAPEPAPSPAKFGNLDVIDPKSRAAQRCADGIHRYQFNSVSEAVEDALCDYAQNDTNRERVRSTQADALSGQSQWGNYFTRERLLAEMFNPSESLLTAVDEMRQRLIGALDLPTTPRRKVRRGQDYGDELDADRWLTRNPDAWERSVREAQPRRTVTIGCNITVNSKVTAEQLLYRGAAALALADVLAQRGCNVSIVVFKSTTDPTFTVGHGVVRYVVKEPMMPLDLSAVAFAMCEIAFFRCIGVCGAARHWRRRRNSGWDDCRGRPRVPGRCRPADRRRRRAALLLPWVHQAERAGRRGGARRSAPARRRNRGRRRGRWRA